MKILAGLKDSSELFRMYGFRPGLALLIMPEYPSSRETGLSVVIPPVAENRKRHGNFLLRLESTNNRELEHLRLVSGLERTFPLGASMPTIPASRAKRVARFLLFSLLGTVAFVVLIFVSSRIVTDSILRGIESSRATGLSSFLQVGVAQPFSDNLQVVRTGLLVLGTRDFDAVRGGLNSVVKERHGRFDELEITARQDSGRTLTATIRVPAEEFDSTVLQLKALGVTEQESQTDAQSSAAESDALEAKLASARFTEDRLDRLTREHSGKLGEYLEVEQEIAKVRGEIEELQVQQRKRTQRVRYAVIRINLKEEFAERFDLKRTVVSARLHSAIVSGLQGVVRQGESVLSIVLQVGPSLVLWLALLYWPVRFSWRRIRRFLAAHTLVPPSLSSHSD